MSNSLSLESRTTFHSSISGCNSNSFLRLFTHPEHFKLVLNVYFVGFVLDLENIEDNILNSMAGIIIALCIISVWFCHLLYCLFFVSPMSNLPLTIFHCFFQGYLFTGLFITAHDAMHGTVSKNRNVNYFIGFLACFLFAGLSYKRLVDSHQLHHKHPTDETLDPDFHHSNNFFLWFISFMIKYTTVSQLVIMAIVFNILLLWFQQSSILVFWVIPSFIGTIQLFTFGTYLPHKKPHTLGMGPHFARSIKKNHFLAMITCYFFGYHSEHHHFPHLPWWKLYSVKNNQIKSI